MKLRNPASSASLITSPSPYVVARKGSRSSSVSIARPEVRAISIMAVSPSPSAPHSAVTALPMGPVTVAERMSPPVASTKVSSVPSPPSATGTRTVSTSETTLRTPSSIALAASSAEILPLKLCGAMTTFISCLSLQLEYADTISAAEGNS